MTLEAVDVVVRRGGRALLHGVDIALAPGRLTAILGPNGAGKSTLLKTLSGDIAPDQGRVTLDGCDLSRWSAADLARRRAVLPQDVPLAFAFTVREVVGWGARSLPPRTADRLAAQALAAVEAAHLADRPVPVLSGGERRRVHLARALVQCRAAEGPGRAPVLLLDEPTAGLDLAARLARDGYAVAAVLHDLDLAATYADLAVLMADGRIVGAGAVGDVLTPARVAAVYRVRTAAETCPHTGRTLVRTIGAV